MFVITILAAVKTFISKNKLFCEQKLFLLSTTARLTNEQCCHHKSRLTDEKDIDDKTKITLSSVDI